MAQRVTGAAAALSEKAFSQQVYDLARMQGWRAARFPTWRPTGTDPGFPDLVLVRPPRLVFAELKSSKGQLTRQQGEWMSALEACRYDPEDPVAVPEVYVWWPDDWDSIEEVLR